MDAGIEEQIWEEASKRIKANTNPHWCPVRIVAEVTLELDPRKLRVEIEQHVCDGEPPCPDILERETS